MKKQSIHLSLAKTLLLTVVILFSYTCPSFAHTPPRVKSPVNFKFQDDDGDESDQEDQATEEGDDQEDAESSDEDEGSSVEGDVDNGKELFKANCASCHQRYKRSTGPALHGVIDKVPSRQWIYDWVHNSTEVLDSGDDYAQQIYDEFNQTAMTHFPGLSEDDIDDILAYVEQPKPEPKTEVAENEGGKTASGGGGISNDIVLAVLALVLILLIVILILVNKTLTRFAQEKDIEIYTKEKEKRKPLWKMIVENQFIAIAFSIVVLLIGSYWAYYYLMQIGVDQGYQPVQPIHYSHRIHAGENQIECKYCHYTARQSKTSGIPSLNVCMNCHMAISEVSEETATDEYSKEYYDNEIAKLYDAVGWDAQKHQYTGETHPVKWVRVHNLPDFAYFNHSQHVEVGKIDCQKCHGEVEDMEVMRQDAKLTMGWCLDCHRNTNVKMEGNKYYEKIHEQLSKKYGVDKLTEAEMGGLECGRCHY